MNKLLADLRIKIFADGADLDGMLEMYSDQLIQGFTTNPTLMRKVGVTDYERFARDVVEKIPDRPISFEVFADDPVEMKAQASKIASWGSNVYVKIPVTTTSGASCDGLIRELVDAGANLNITAVMTPAQVEQVARALDGTNTGFISVFAGRIADTGRDPIPIMKECLDIVASQPALELMWASPREVLNIFQADEIGCHIITVTNDLLKKLDLIGKDLLDFSLDTVRMFFEDGRAAGYDISTPEGR